MSEFAIPSFLLNHSTDENHQRMREIIPADIDMSEGGHAYNMTRPTAMIAAELYEFILPEVVKLIIPQWSYGEFLDFHAADRKLIRKSATPATGKLVITGWVTTHIPAGSQFSTAAVNGAPSVHYVTKEAVTIPEAATVTVEIECAQTGIIGNTGANTIVMVSNNITGISSVTNPDPVSGGTEEETDESLRKRIQEYDQNQGDSFVGSAANYKQWATTVSGVGNATIISAQDTSGLVTIILTDANGEPATEQLCRAVYNYIMNPDNPDERLAPINAILEVVPPAPMELGIKVTVELEDEATLEAVKAAFKAQLGLYLPVALEEGEIKYTRVAAVLAATEGANDYSDLQIGLKTDGVVAYGTSNIPITTSQLPTISLDDLILTAGTV